LIERKVAGEPIELVWRRADRILTGAVALGEAPRTQTPQRAERAAHVIAVARVAPGQTVAEVGFGGGWLSLALAAAVGTEGRVVATEISPRSVDSFRGRAAPNTTVLLTPPDDTTLPENTFDAVILHDVASHVLRAGRPTFYASIARALKPGAALVVFGPHGDARARLDELAGHGFRAEGAAALAALSNDELDRRLEAGLRFFPVRR
jgi:tRNA A58 N-methylase Trm61